MRFIGQILTPSHHRECFRALESVVIMIANGEYRSLEDVHPRSLERLAHRLCINGGSCYPSLKVVVVCITRPAREDFSHRFNSDSVIWSTFEPLDIWDSAIRVSLSPIESLGMEVKVKWMGCNKLVWHSWMKGSGI
jgi:hypothetical protein